MGDETSSRRFLWIVAQRSIIGISIENLLRLGKSKVVKNIDKLDWNSLSPIPSDFLVDNLPEDSLHPFLYDSKLLFSGGQPFDYHLPAVSSKFYQLLLQYKNNDDDKKQQLRLSEDPSIPPLPTEFCYEPLVANIGGKVYLFHYDRMKTRDKPIDEGFWVLEHPGREWRSLKPPPPFGNVSFGIPEVFTLHDKLFFRIWMGPGHEQTYLYVLDITNDAPVWKEVDDKLLNAIPITPVALPSPPPLAHQIVALTWERMPSGYNQARVEIEALLLDTQHNSVSVSCSQSFVEDLSTPILSPTFDPLTCEAKFVDLGKGMVCALVSGFPSDDSDARATKILCVFVFSISLSSSSSSSAGTSDEKQKRQRFLDVEVIVNRTFILPPYLEERQMEGCYLDQEGDLKEGYYLDLDEDEDEQGPFYLSESLRHALIFPSMEDLCKGTESRKRRKLLIGRKGKKKTEAS